MVSSHTLSVNGQLKVSGGVVIAPSAQPTTAVSGQIYYDQGTNVLSYYNGTQFIDLPGNGQVVRSLGGVSGTITLGTGLTMNAGQLRANGIVSFTSASTTLTVTNDGNGNVTLSDNRQTGVAGVQTNGGTVGRIAYFNGASSIADSLLSQTTTNVDVAGTLSVADTFSLQSAATATINLTSNTTGVTGQIYNDGNLHITGGQNNLWLDAGGTGTIFLNSSNGNKVAIGEASIPAYPLEVNGDVNITASHAYRIDGTVICTISGCLSASATASLQTAYDNSVGGTTPDIKLSIAKSSLDIQDADSTIGSNLLNVRASNAGGLGQILLGVGPTGAITAQNSSNSTAAFVVENAAGAAQLTVDTTNSKVIIGALQTNSLTPTAALTVGSSSQSFTVQGNASSTLTATSGANTTSLVFQTPTASVTYRFLTAAAGTYDICTSVGNCAGAGSGVTTPGGTAGTIARFTAGQTIGDSIITDNGTTVTIGGALSVNTITPTAALTVGATGQNLTLQGATVQLTSTNAGVTNSLVFATPASGNKTITIPNVTGTVCLDSGNCLGGGGGGANTSLSNLTGVAINTSLLPNAASGINLGSGTLPFGDLYLGGSSVTPGTNNFKVTGTSTGGTRTITLPDATGTICLQNASSCGFATGSGTAFVQGGNNFGVAAELGTNDNNALNLRTNGTTRAVLSADGSTLTFASNLSLIMQGATSVITNAQNTTHGEAFGAGATTANGSVAVGYQASNYNNGVAIGYQAQSSSTNGVAVGYQANGGFLGTAIGTGSSATTTGATAIGDAATAGNNYSIALGFSANTTAANQLVIGGDDGSGNGAITQVVVGNGAANGAPVGFTLQGTGGSGANVAGASVAIAGGAGTGSANGGDIKLQVATPGASGSSANVPATVVTISGANGSSTFKNTVNSTAGFAVQNAAGNQLFAVDTSNAQVVLGKPSTFTGKLVFDGSGSTNTITLVGQNTPGGNRTLTLPDESGTLCSTGSVCAGYAPSTGGTGYIQNTSTLQTNANIAIQSSSDAAITLRIRERSTQSADTFRIEDSGGNYQVSVDNFGGFHVANKASFDQQVGVGISGSSGEQLRVVAAATNILGLTVGGQNGQTADVAQINSNASTASALKVNATNNSAANTAWSAIALNVTNAQGTTAVSTGTIAGLDLQFTQNPTVAGNTETVANLAVKQNDTSVTDNTVSSILNVANNDTATGNQITVTDGIKINGANLTNGINLSGTFGSNLITSTNFVVAQGGLVKIQGGGTNGSGGQLQFGSDGQITLGEDTGDSDVFMVNARVAHRFYIDGTQVGEFGQNGLLTVNSRNSFGGLNIVDSTNHSILQAYGDGSQVQIGYADTIGALLVLDTKTNAGDPTGINGGMYYNSSSGKLRCFEGGAWSNCTGVSGATLQTAYNNSTSPEIVLNSTNGALTVRDNATPIGADLFEVQNNAGTVSDFAVSASGVLVGQPLTVKTQTDGVELTVKTTLNNNMLTVDGSNSRVGIGLGGSNLPALTNSGLEVKGALRLSGGRTGADTYTTPLGASLETLINIPNYDPGSFNQVVAMGLPSTASATARVISLLDARTVAHQPTIGVLSPNENNIFGLSWDGDNSVAAIKSSSSTVAIQGFSGSALNIATFKTFGGTDGRLGVANGSPSYTLDVAGDVNTSTQYRIGGTVICTSSGCTPAAGSSNYIQNTTTAQSSNMYVQAATSGSVAATIRANAAGSGDVLDLKNGSGTNVATFSSIGAALFQNSFDSINALTVKDALGTNTLLNIDTSNTRVGIGGAASFSKFEVQGGDAAIYNNGGNPRLIIGNSTSAGQNGFLQYDSSNNYLRIETTGTNGLKINDNFVTIGNIFPNQPLTVANGTTQLFQVTTTGTVSAKTTTNSTAGFQVQNSGGVEQLTVDTSNSRVYVGPTAGDTTGTILVLGNKTNAGDPTGVAGAMYYNANGGKFRCYENGAWKNCLGFNANLSIFGGDGNGAAAQWTNMPASLTEIFTPTDVSVPSSRMLFDLTDAQQIRFQVNVAVVGAASAELRIQYSTDQSTWNYLDNGATGLGQNISTTGFKTSSWSNIASGAKGDVYLRVVGINGDGALDPRFGLIQVQAR